MSGSLFVWIRVLLAAVWAAHWGAEHLSDPLKKLRRRWGFSVAAGGAFVGLAAASPEVGINATSALRGVGDPLDRSPPSKRYPLPGHRRLKHQREAVIGDFAQPVRRGDVDRVEPIFPVQPVLRHRHVRKKGE